MLIFVSLLTGNQAYWLEVRETAILPQAVASQFIESTVAPVRSKNPNDMEHGHSRIPVVKVKVGKENLAVFLADA